MGKYYLYQHIRLDKNIPFYVGIGVKNFRRKDGFCRAYAKANRTRYWKNIINISSYKVEILMESDNYKFIKQKEIEFIKLYGRKDLKKGTLVNLTDGGEGAVGRLYKPTKETIEKVRASLRGRKVEKSICEQISRISQR